MGYSPECMEGVLGSGQHA